MNEIVKGSLILEKNQSDGTLLEPGCQLVLECRDTSPRDGVYQRSLETRESKEVPVSRVRELLVLFTEEDLRDFCFFEPAFRDGLYERLPQGKTQIIREILDFASRKGLIPIVLKWVEDENPIKYQEWCDGKLAGKYAVKPKANA